MHRTKDVAVAALLSLSVSGAAHAQAILVSGAPALCGAQALMTEQVLLSPPHLETRIVPAQYELARRQEMVSPERVERRTDTAVYKMVTETKVISPTRIVYRATEPAVRTVEQSVTTAPAAGLVTIFAAVYGLPGAWPAAYAPVTYVAQPPAQVASVQTQVADNPGYVVERVIPAVTKTETRKVLVKPAQTYQTVVPATYRTVSYMREVAPARTETIQAPALYEARQVLRPIVCQAVALAPAARAPAPTYANVMVPAPVGVAPLVASAQPAPVGPVVAQAGPVVTVR